MESLETRKGKDWKSAVYAGFFAANGSVFGKFTGNAAKDFRIIQNTYFEESIFIIQGISFALMVICNVLNWRFYVKALHSTDHNTLFATVMSAASNYFFSFFVGFVLFGEDLSLYSLVGISFIILGLFFLCQDTMTAEEQKSKNIIPNQGSSKRFKNQSDVSKKEK